MNKRFGFPEIEHSNRATIEPFSANCVDVCTQPNIDDNLKLACDYGTIRHCSSFDNIVKPECIAHAERVVRTYVAEKTNIAYTNKLPTAIKRQDAYDAIINPIFAYFGKNAANLSSTDIKKLLDIIDLEKTLPDESKILYFLPYVLSWMHYPHILTLILVFLGSKRNLQKV